MTEHADDSYSRSGNFWQFACSQYVLMQSPADSINVYGSRSGEFDGIESCTRQHSYRKEDRAMRPIYGCHEKFSESSLRIRLIFQNFVMDFCSDRY